MYRIYAKYKYLLTNRKNMCVPLANQNKTKLLLLSFLANPHTLTAVIITTQ